MNGQLIVFDGGEGAGKSTQVEQLHSRLLDAGVPTTVTREPGGTPLGQKIRTMLLSADTPTPWAEALLFAADRAHHVDTVIRPALDAGQVVVCDRYEDSLIAYQGHGRNLGAVQMAWLSRWATGNLQPDLVVLLDIDPKLGLQRSWLRQAASPDRIEREELRFHTHARFGFKQRAATNPSRYLVLDATQPPEYLARLIWERVEPMIERMS